MCAKITHIRKHIHIHTYKRYKRIRIYVYINTHNMLVTLSAEIVIFERSILRQYQSIYFGLLD